MTKTPDTTKPDSEQPCAKRLSRTSRVLKARGSASLRKPRRPSLTHIAAQAKKAGIEVARIEIAADGSYTVVSKDESTVESNPWLTDLKVTKR